MSVAILGLGVATPTHSIRQDDAAELAKALCCETTQQATILPALYRRSGVERRGSVLLDDAGNGGCAQHFFPPPSRRRHGPTTRQRMARYAKEAPVLAIGATQAALRESRFAPGRIRQIVTVSCTGLMAPGIDLALIRAFGFSPSVGRTHIGFMGCHGALNGLRIGSALASQAANTGVLMCAVELCSLHFHYGWEPERMVANALFADGAAALVLADGVTTRRNVWRVLASGSCLFPESESDMTWTVGNHGFTMTLSARVPGLIIRHLRPWLDDWLAEFGLRRDAIRAWAVHPGGPRILQAVSTSLELPADALAVSKQVLAEHGNMSSPTALFILDRLRQAGLPRPCVVLGFGPGLVVEAALLA